MWFLVRWRYGTIYHKMGGKPHACLRPQAADSQLHYTYLLSGGRYVAQRRSDRELEVVGGRITLEAVRDNPRKDRDRAIREMAANKDDGLLVADDIEIDMEEWEW